MKKLFVTALCAVAITACKKEGEGAATSADSTTTDTTTEVQKTTPDIKPFDAKDIPLAKADFGKFPYFEAPEGNEYINGGGELKGIDQVLVPVNDVMVPVQGPAFRAIIHAKEKDGWSREIVKQRYAEAITVAGGIKIFDKRVPQAEIDRVKDQVGSTMDYWNQPVQVYALKKPDGTIVFVQLCMNTAGGGIVVTETKKFTMQ